jgi:hypothetical protein
VTIRQHIRRRVRWALIAFVVLFAGTFLLPHKAGPLAVVLGVAGTIGAMVAYCSVVFLRCPKCKANIGTSIVVPTAFRLFGREVKYCPYCAVSLDSEMPQRELDSDL